jgi:hypothetical protein
VTELAGDVLGNVQPIVDTVTDVLGDVTAPVTELAGDLFGEVGTVAATVTDVLSDVTAPVTELAGDVLGEVGTVAATVTDVLGDVTTPVTELAGDLLGEVGTVAATVTDVLDDVTTPVTELAGDLLGETGTIGTTVTNLVDDIGSPSPELPADIIGEVQPVVDTVTNAVGDATAPVTELAGDIAPLASVLETLDDGLNGSGVTLSIQASVVADAGDLGHLSGSGDTAGGGTIAFPDLPAIGGAVADVLFNGNGYTSYSLALQAETGHAEGGTPPDAPADTHSSILDVVVSDDSDDASDNHNIFASIGASVGHSSLFGSHGLL